MATVIPAAPTATPVSSESISLGHEAAKLGSIKERLEETKIRALIYQRWVLLGAIVAIFIVLNYMVISMVGEAFEVDRQLLTDKTATVPQFVTKEVLMSLIGATVIQVGAAVYAIVKFLFPGDEGAR